MNVLSGMMGVLFMNGAGFLGIILKAIIIAAIGILIIHLLNKALDKFLNKSKLEKAAHSLIKAVAKTVMAVLLALIVASSVGIDVTGIVALASVLTLAVSLSLQDMLSNVIGGFMLIYTKPFSAGDYVDIGSESGTVLEIGMTYTKLATIDNKVISIPNKSVVAADVVNYSALGTRRVDISITASYDADAKLVVGTLLKAAEDEKILSDPAPFAALSGYGDNSIEYTLRVWTNTADYWDVYFSILAKIKPMFDEKGIEMTYPHLNVHLDK